MKVSYTDTGYNLACGSDKKGNVWEVRKSESEYHLFKNGRYETAMNNATNIMVVFNQVLRQEK